ncbi:hypothetical protein ACI3EY_17070 [Ornithinimicrobium sp. LYQ92]|uniref:hypothetical protein n=1 Tax=Serinicoccus sp. LYQ92 TaxID=3378798 RepID=UPI003853CF18
MHVKLRPVQRLNGLALQAHRRGDPNEVARLRGEVTLNKIRNLLSRSSPLQDGQVETAKALIDEAVVR